MELKFRSSFRFLNEISTHPPKRYLIGNSVSPAADFGKSLAVARRGGFLHLDDSGYNTLAFSPPSGS